MCGIAGYWSSCLDVDALHRMTDALVHRGPDGSGHHVDGDVALGMRRLAIIDVVHGSQPYFDERGDVVVVFNGEIYNYRSLSDDVRARGHELRSAADGECIAHLYEEHGPDFVERIDGMFAIALWDKRRRRLLLYRDRIGKKPLVWWRGPDGDLAFASEVKALRAAVDGPWTIDRRALHDYLTLQYVPAPRTIYEEATSVLPGHYVAFDGTTTSSHRYWGLDHRTKLDVDEETAVDLVDEQVREATARRLNAERPIGAFLSGGVDSSLVVAHMAKVASGAVRTFSVGFADQAFDELPYARHVADRYGTDHTELRLDVAPLEAVTAINRYYDQPFADSSAIPSYLIARETARSVTVVLNGDGGDEGFGGYERYVAANVLGRVALGPRARSAVGALARRLPQRGAPRSAYRLARRGLEMLSQSGARQYADVMSYFDEREKAALYADGFRQETEGWDTWDLFDAWFAEAPVSDRREAPLAVDLVSYLPDDLLVKVDIATMANGLEARSPLLDRAVLELAASLPVTMKVRGRRTKHVLKRVAERHFDPEHVHRRKQGFGIPLASWLRTDLREYSRDLLLSDVARGRGYFDPAAVERMLDEHDRGIDHGGKLWALLQLEAWHVHHWDR